MRFLLVEGLGVEISIHTRSPADVVNQKKVRSCAVEEAPKIRFHRSEVDLRNLPKDLGSMVSDNFGEQRLGVNRRALRQDTQSILLRQRCQSSRNASLASTEAAATSG